jgi:hypothetical protein
MKPQASLLTIALVAVASHASAQPTVQPMPAASPAVAAPPAVPQAAPVPAPVPMPESIPLAAPSDWCGLREVMGVPGPDARTASKLVCDELWRKVQGKPAGTYRVSVGKLGSRILLGVESWDGVNRLDERHMEMSSIEETSSVAQRLAAALIDKKDTAETAAATNTSSVEAQAKNQKSGHLKVEFGILGAMPLTVAVAPGAGLYGKINYELEAAVFALGARFAANDKMATAGMDVGGDMHIGSADTAPFLGGGLAMTYLNVNAPDSFRGSRFGLGGFAQGGVTAFRSSRTNLRAGVRLELPMYTLAGVKGSYNDAGTYVSAPNDTRYVPSLQFFVGMTLY